MAIGRVSDSLMAIANSDIQADNELDELINKEAEQRAVEAKLAYEDYEY